MSFGIKIQIYYPLVALTLIEHDLELCIILLGISYIAGYSTEVV
nr:MAG TPA: hypothetical protein [Caudoviricetes sp.]